MQSEDVSKAESNYILIFKKPKKSILNEVNSVNIGFIGVMKFTFCTHHSNSVGTNLILNQYLSNATKSFH